MSPSSVRFSLPDAPFLRAPFLREVVEALQGEPQNPEDGKREGIVRYVGGVVRNALLNLPCKDVDLATPLLPQQVVERLEARGLRVIPTGLSHGTVRVMARSSCGEQNEKDRTGGREAEVRVSSCEITTLRRDEETDGRRARVAFTQDWAEDATRRDFTVNALSFDPVTGQGWDYVGGVSDLRAHRLRFIGEPSERIAEDFLRILRLFRFVSQYPRFVVEERDLRACREGQDGLSGLSGERIASELLLLLGGEDPCRALRLMGEWDVCAVAGWRWSEPVVKALERMVSFEHEIACEDACRRLLFLVAFGERTGEGGREEEEDFKKMLTRRLIFATSVRKRFASLKRGFAR